MQGPTKSERAKFGVVCFVTENEPDNTVPPDFAAIEAEQGTGNGSFPRSPATGFFNGCRYFLAAGASLAQTAFRAPYYVPVKSLRFTHTLPKGLHTIF